MQVDGEGEHRQRTHDEGRHADADHGERRAQVVDPGVFPHGGDDAGGETEREGEGEGEQAEFERDGQLVGDDFVDGAVGVFERRSEVAVRQAAEIAEVLPVKGLVQAVVRLEVAEDLRRHGFLRRERTARHETDHEERGRDDHEQDGNRLKQAAGDEAKHREEVSVKVRVKGRGDEETFPAGAPMMAGGPPEPSPMSPEIPAVGPDLVSGPSRAYLSTVGSELARAVCQSASKLADLRGSIEQRRSVISPAATRSCRTASTTRPPASRGRPGAAENSSR